MVPVKGANRRLKPTMRKGAVGFLRRAVGAADFIQLPATDSQRLFYENWLAMGEGGNHVLGMAVMAGEHEYRVRVPIFDELRRLHGAGKVKQPAGGFGSDA